MPIHMPAAMSLGHRTSSSYVWWATRFDGVLSSDGRRWIGRTKHRRFLSGLIQRCANGLKGMSSWDDHTARRGRQSRLLT